MGEPDYRTDEKIIKEDRIKIYEKVLRCEVPFCISGAKNLFSKEKVCYNQKSSSIIEDKIRDILSKVTGRINML